MGDQLQADACSYIPNAASPLKKKRTVKRDFDTEDKTQRQSSGEAATAFSCRRQPADRMSKHASGEAATVASTFSVVPIPYHLRRWSKSERFRRSNRVIRQRLSVGLNLGNQPKSDLLLGN